MKTRALNAALTAATLVLSVVALAPCFAEQPDAGPDATPARFDYHQVRGREAVASALGTYEGETHFTLQGKARVQPMRNFGPGWSGDAHLLWDGVVGESLETTFDVAKGGRFRLSLQLTKAPDYGVFSIRLNGRELRTDVDLYAPRVELAGVLNLGEIALQAGQQKLVCKLTGGNQRAKKFRDRGYLLGLDFLKLVSLDPPPKPKEAQPAERTSKQAGAVATSTSTRSLEEMKPVLTRFCYGCHSGDDPAGEINLKALANRQDFLTQIDVTSKIANVLARQQMPPEDEPRLSGLQHQQLTALVDAVIDEHLRTATSLVPVVMRRLNRYEYNNAVRDLLQLKGDIYPLPEKVIRATSDYFKPASGHFPSVVSVGNRALGKNQIEQHILTGVSPFAIDLQSEHGFNNRGAELSTSPILLESFLQLGQSIVYSPEFDSYCGLHSSLFTIPPNKSTAIQIGHARKRLAAFLERATRRPADAAMLDRYTQYFVSELLRTKSFTASMKSVVAAVLASPNFLYLTEEPVHTPDGGQHALPVTAWELASRLSFFLWSSLPDDELLGLARSGELLEADVLERQVRRMLEDPRSKALAENFARQWLRLDQLITAVPDFDRFPRYYSRIGCEQWKFGLQTMVEPLLLFESIMVEDRSIMLLIDSNYSYRSDELQSWYNDAVPFGDRQNVNRFNTFQQSYRRRRLTTRRQGGVLTAAAMLTMTSAPLRTSPITRGAWVATVIFNQPPPPPPDVVPPIESDDAVFEAKGLTLRERLKQHQVNQSCVSCHSKIDPLGFALENFDAVGRWRDTYRSGLEIDAAGELFGEAKFSDVVGLKDAILEHPQWYMRAFSEHLLSYALSRELQLADKPAVDRIVRNVMADHGQFSTVVVEVAKSYPFLHKAGQPAELTP